MTIHAIILGIVIATLLGALFHILRGGSLQRLGLYTLAANLSFFLGHGFGELINWKVLRVGAINLFPAILAVTLGLILTSSLAGEEPPKSPTPPRRRKRSE